MSTLSDWPQVTLLPSVPGHPNYPTAPASPHHAQNQSLHELQDLLFKELQVFL